MTLLRRSAGLVTIGLSVLGLLLCLAAVAGVWAVKGQVDRLVAASFDTADDAFDFLDTRLTRVKQSVERSRDRSRTLSQRAQRLSAPDADIPAEAEPLRQAIDAAYRELQAAEHWLDSSEAVARGVNRIAESVAASRADASQNGVSQPATSHADDPPASARGVNAKKVAEFSADVADAIARLEVIRQALLDLRENRTLAREFAARTITRVADLDKKLSNLSTRIAAFQLRVTASRANCAELGRSVQWWIGFGAIAVTLVPLWFAASQVGMMVHGWRFGRAGGGSVRQLDGS